MARWTAFLAIAWAIVACGRAEEGRMGSAPRGVPAKGSAPPPAPPAKRRRGAGPDFGAEESPPPAAPDAGALPDAPAGPSPGEAAAAETERQHAARSIESGVFACIARLAPTGHARPPGVPDEIRVDVTFVVLETGRVERADVSVSPPSDRDTVRCVRDGAEAIRFPPAPVGRDTVRASVVARWRSNAPDGGVAVAPVLPPPIIPAAPPFVPPASAPVAVPEAPSLVPPAAAATPVPASPALIPPVVPPATFPPVQPGSPPTAGSPR